MKQQKVKGKHRLEKAYTSVKVATLWQKEDDVKNSKDVLHVSL